MVTSLWSRVRPCPTGYRAANDTVTGEHVTCEIMMKRNLNFGISSLFLLPPLERHLWKSVQPEGGGCVFFSDLKDYSNREQK